MDFGRCGLPRPRRQEYLRLSVPRHTDRINSLRASGQPSGMDGETDIQGCTSCPLPPSDHRDRHIILRRAPAREQIPFADQGVD